MAYMNQEMKKKIAAALKPIMSEWGVKGTLKTTRHSVTLTLREGAIDFGKVYGGVNHYWIHEHYTGAARTFLERVYAAMKAADWFDHSDAQADYFCTAYYINIEIGRYDKNYVLLGKSS